MFLRQTVPDDQRFEHACEREPTLPDDQLANFVKLGCDASKPPNDSYFSWRFLAKQTTCSEQNRGAQQLCPDKSTDYFFATCRAQPLNGQPGLQIFPQKLNLPTKFDAQKSRPVRRDN